MDHSVIAPPFLLSHIFLFLSWRSAGSQVCIYTIWLIWSNTCLISFAQLLAWCFTSSWAVLQMSACSAGALMTAMGPGCSSSCEVWTMWAERPDPGWSLFASQPPLACGAAGFITSQPQDSAFAFAKFMTFLSTLTPACPAQLSE